MLEDAVFILSKKEENNLLKIQITKKPNHGKSTKTNRKPISKIKKQSINFVQSTKLH